MLKPHGPAVQRWSIEKMRTRGSLVQLKRYQIREGTRQVTQLDMMIAEFERMAQELELQIRAEEQKAGIFDVDHFAYPTFAKAARQRRDNLVESRAGLEEQRASAIAALAVAEAELARAETLETRECRNQASEPSSMRNSLAG